MSKDGYSKCTIPKNAPNLILAGDIGRPADPAFFQTFLMGLLSVWERVFYVPGNHDHWESSVVRTTLATEHFCGSFEAQVKAYRQGILEEGDLPDLGEFVFLNRRTYHFPANPDGSAGPSLLGCTLWSSMEGAAPDVVRELNDYFPDYAYIRDWNTTKSHEQHRMERAWLNAEVAKLKQRGRKATVVTHHGPLARGCSAPELDGSRHSCMFNTEMSGDELWNASVLKNWIFGHTHWSVDFEHKGVRVVANQKGYKGEDTRYAEAGKVIEI